MSTPHATDRFLIRNYKHQLLLKADGPRSVLHYTDEVWETLCRRIVEHGFRGLVLYPDTGHPFEHILDYAGFPEAASRPSDACRAKREALNRGLATAHRHGLRTFLQHYVSHVPRAFAARLELGASTGQRCANLVHPEIDRYCRWFYRETFAQLPDLDGLYFNFESSQDMRHVENTAVRVWNGLKRKPMAVWRVWGLERPEGLCRVVAAYRGASVLCHKVSDTNDVYYLPVADSRVRDWKTLLPKTPFIFEVGPCHNCGTNVQGQLWSDYAFVQELLADAARKGADGISFHTVNEFFAPDVATPGVFDATECALARLNWLHLLAAPDFLSGRRRSKPERAAALAQRNGVAPEAGRPLLETVEASSQLVLLAFRQFCYGSANEGVTNPGWYSHIQEPFYFWPASELNGQASRLMWRPVAHMPWIRKHLDAKVCPDDTFQYILDEADPDRPAVRWPPRRIAATLGRLVGKAERAGRQFERLVGRAQAAPLRRLLAHNAMLADYYRHEVEAARSLFALYFAGDAHEMRRQVARGLAHLSALAPLLRQDPEARKSFERVTMISLFDPAAREVPPVRELARALRQRDVPIAAFVETIASHRHYNEIRRVVRPQRLHTPATLRFARQQLALARATAEHAVRQLPPGSDRAWEVRIREWCTFLDDERRRMVPPRARCGASPGPALGLAHDHCFRNGEHFVTDLLGFFRRVDWLQPAGISFRLWRTATALVVALREDGVDVAARLARWEEFAGSGSDSFVTRIHVAPDGREPSRDITVYPKGSVVTMDRSADLPAVRRSFASGDDWWETTVRVPFRLLGGPPAPGATWGLNITANPFVRRGTCYTWAAQYDCDNPRLYGRITFDKRGPQ